MPKIPEYALPNKPGVQGDAYIYGGEYLEPKQGYTNHNVPCAVCEVTSQEMQLTIP